MLNKKIITSDTKIRRRATTSRSGELLSKKTPRPGCQKKVAYQDRFEAVLETTKEFPGVSVGQLCKIAKVSRSGYYRWLKEPITNKQRSDLMLKIRIKALFNENKEKYGYRRITMLLNRRFNYHINPKRVRRLMVELGLRSVIRRSNKSCTISYGHNCEPNLL